jgi:hypothetical protein
MICHTRTWPTCTGPRARMNMHTRDPRRGRGYLYARYSTRYCRYAQRKLVHFTDPVQFKVQVQQYGYAGTVGNLAGAGTLQGCTRATGMNLKEDPSTLHMHTLYVSHSTGRPLPYAYVIRCHN